MKQKEISIKKGYKLTGRWDRQRYTVVKHIGKGGTGLVCLVRDAKGALRAMKISSDLASITHEHRILMSINHCKELQELGIAPTVFELDDFQVGDTVYHYMITEYCEGISLSKYSGKLGIYDVAGVGRQVAGFLERLHRQGFVFGDLKPSNVVYDCKSKRVRLVDFGSVTLNGNGLKQYTPSYDRATWRAGSRIADEGYDLFALGMLMTTLVMGKVDNKVSAGLQELITRISGACTHKLLKETIIKALRQQDLRGVSENLARIISEEPWNLNRETDWFVRTVGMASAAAFILSLAYYYQ